LFELARITYIYWPIEALQKLDLNGCFSLQELPTSVEQLSALQKFDLNGCSSLQKLPTSIGQLSALQTLICIVVGVSKKYIHLLSN
jgi:Leucine-rich repeat (LRR) protein